MLDIIATYQARVQLVQPKPSVLLQRFDKIARVGQTHFSQIPEIKPAIKGSGALQRTYQLIKVPGATNDATQPFDREGVLRFIQNNRHRPALYEEGLCVAKKNPDAQRRISIVLLGSETILDNKRHVACLYGDRFERGIYLFELGTALLGDLSFLVTPV
jgi:hypothetical protein